MVNSYSGIGIPQSKMRPGSGDTNIDVDQVNIENSFKTKKVDSSAQTLHLVPYRLRFLPSTSCDVKLGPSEKNCGLRCNRFCRIFSQWLLSQVGLSVIVVIWALLGALAFYNTEGPRELEQSKTLAKIQKDLSVELATALKQAEHNQDAWPKTIHKYFEKHETLFLDAVGAGFGEGGGGNIWTYPGCVLFSVSLLTTLGFGAPVPRTSLGRGTAVLFAAIGIPLHFLLVLNMGNLGAIKLQQLANRNCLTEVPSTPRPTWLKLFPFLSIIFYYMLGNSEQIKILENVKDEEQVFHIQTTDTKTKISREFFVTSGGMEGLNMVQIVRQYLQLRPRHTIHARFFVGYRNGACIRQPVGINTFAMVPNNVALFLKLPDPTQYTGHCFRRPSASWLADSGADLLTIKRWSLEK